MSVWVAFKANLLNHQSDPHITLAYLPTEPTPRHLNSLVALTSEFRATFAAPFFIHPLSVALFMPLAVSPVRVLKVLLPPSILRQSKIFRDDIQNHGFPLDTTYSFTPHITIKPSHYYHDRIPLPNDPRLTSSPTNEFPISSPLLFPPISVTEIFIHNDEADTRTVFYLPK